MEREEDTLGEIAMALSCLSVYDIVVCLDGGTGSVGAM